MQAPGHTDDTEATRAAHHLLLAHGLALAAFRERRPGTKLGITNLISNLNPASDSAADAAATRVTDIRFNRIFLEPVYHGSYGEDVAAVFGMHGITVAETDDGLVRHGDLALISAPTDFAGVNHYTNTLISADPGVRANGTRMSAGRTDRRRRSTGRTRPRRCATCCCASRASSRRCRCT